MNFKMKYRLCGLIMAVAVFASAIASCLTVLSLPFKERQSLAQALTFVPQSMELSNSNFTSSSGSFPKTPSSWTGNTLGSSADSVISGVVDLNASDYGEHYKTTFKLDNYPTIGNNFFSMHENLFALSGDSSVLMINNYGTASAYAYTSAQLTLVANNYYRISVWVCTSTFSSGTGAYIRLSNTVDKHDLSFDTIDTTNYSGATNENLGWQKYTFYIEGSSFQSINTNLSLQVGHSRTNEKGDVSVNYAEGVAFFDNIVAENISASIYYNEKALHQSNTRQFIFKSFKTPDANQVDNFDFEGTLTNTWQRIGSSNTSQGTFADRVMTDIDAFESQKQNYGSIDENPMSPQGGSYVLAIDSPVESAYGFSSSPIDIKMHRNYLLSVMVRTINASGAGVTVKVKGQKYDALETFEEQTSLATVEETSTSLYGWENLSVVIAGSHIGDCEITIELHFGTEDAPQMGTAFFDNVRLEVLNQTEYDEASASANLAIEMTTASTLNIENGQFNIAGNYDEYQYPLAVKSWQSVGAGEKYGGEVVAFDQVKSGIVNLKSDHYEANRHNYGNAVNPVSTTAYDAPNALMIYSPSSTIYGYISPEFTVEANQSKKIVARIATKNIGGAKANLLLRKNGKIISSIENIESESGFQMYSFYVQTNNLMQALTLEIWMGRPDDNENTRTAYGNIFVDFVDIVDLETNESFDQKVIDYKNNSVIGNNIYDLPYAVYSFVNERFTAYDFREDSAIKTPYNWTLNAEQDMIDGSLVRGGIIDTRSPSALSALNMPSFNNKGAIDGQYHVLMLHNAVQTASTYSSLNNENLSAESIFYKVVVRLKTIGIPENQYGAYLRISNLSAEIENINTETRADRIEGENDFVDYIFYIKLSDADKEVSVDIGLGKSDRLANRTQGTIFVSSIDYIAISGTDYENGIADIVAFENEEDDAEEPIGIVYVDLTAEQETEQEDTTTPPAGWDWWLLPTIIFAVALITAIVGVGVKILWAKRSVRVKSNTYDRRKTLERLQRERANRLRLAKKELGEDEGDELDFEDELDDELDFEDEDESEFEDDGEDEEEAQPEETKSEEATEQPETKDDDLDEFKD